MILLHLMILVKCFIFVCQVLEILSHVNKRVKHQPEIGLPLTELWKIYTEANAAPMVKSFCILYIEMAIERVNLKVHMFPMIFTMSLVDILTFSDNWTFMIGKRKYGASSSC